MEMKNGWINSLAAMLLLLLPLALSAQGQIYKVVDKDGNVIYTDQRPSTDAQPMDLPPLSVIQTDNETPAVPAQDALAAEAPALPLTPGELRRQFSDFRLTRPAPEETFWGTENSVVVAWESSQPIPPAFRVVVFVDGEARPATGGAMDLTLDRGEHKVYAELRDGRNRRIVATDPVTFFIQQHSVNRARARG
jgi:hypothetical protein